MVNYLKKFVDTKELNQNFYRGKGCEECGHKGYKGRIGIYEALEVNEKIRQLTIKRVSAEEIHAAALENGMVPLFNDGINKASGGVTTIEEVLRVVRE